MAGLTFQALTGFRDFAPKECAVRNYLFETWRGVARRFGFMEYETPILEDTGLYLKKSGGELSAQLFRFEDQGGRDVTLRPEVTASLARLVAAEQRNFPKPLKWFEIGQCFRYEKPQKGRGREFFQFNVDILGEEGTAADAELIALAIETMRAFGFRVGDFVVRISDRAAWIQYAAEKNVANEMIPEFLNIVDKVERGNPSELDLRLAPFGLTTACLKEFIANPQNASSAYDEISANLAARGLSEFIELDLSIVRGLAYYTGVVFEVFDAKKSMRAVAGGGRYDTLISTISDGGVDLPATGFAMGDYVIRNLIEETAHASENMQAWLKCHGAVAHVYAVIADETKRGDALRLITEWRNAGVSVDFPFAAAKMNKQFQRAEQAGALCAVVIGEEFPQIRVKNLATREEVAVDASEFLTHFAQFVQAN